jgi:hypothetical protein
MDVMIKMLRNLPRATTALALLFALISGITAFQGVSLLRDNAFVAAVFALAVQGSVFVTENLLVTNLSTAKPEKSVIFLFVVFLGFLFIGSSLNAMLFFHVQGTAVASRNAKTASADVWTKSRQDLETFRLTLQQNLQVQGAENLLAITTESQKIATARLAGLTPDLSLRDRLRAQRKELDRAAVAAKIMGSLSLAAPEPRADAEKRLAQAFREASDIFASVPEPVRKGLPTLHPLPMQEPATDFLDLFMTESGKRSGTACLAWGLGAGTECLPFIILLVGMPGIPWALRIRSRKQKCAGIVRELFRAHSDPEKMGALSFRIEQLSLSGTFELVEASAEFTADELEPSLRALEESVEKTAGQRIQIIGLRNSSGIAIRSGVPLRQQLSGQPLYLEVLTDGSGGSR